MSTFLLLGSEKTEQEISKMEQSLERMEVRAALI